MRIRNSGAGELSAKKLMILPAKRPEEKNDGRQYCATPIPVTEC